LRVFGQQTSLMITLRLTQNIAHKCLSIIDFLSRCTWIGG